MFSQIEFHKVHSLFLDLFDNFTEQLRITKITSTVDHFEVVNFTKSEAV